MVGRLQSMEDLSELLASTANNAVQAKNSQKLSEITAENQLLCAIKHLLWLFWLLSRVVRLF